MTTPPSLREKLAEYLATRRALGYRLDKLELLAGQFCDWLTEQGKTNFTLDDALTWARLPAEADLHWWGMRLGAVRTFARYLHATGMPVQVPPRGILPAGPCRAVPYIYSQADLDALLRACPSTFPRGFLAATMATLTGLLAATGIRIGEALRLTPADITTDHNTVDDIQDDARDDIGDGAGDDISWGVLLIRASKNGTDRLVPIHPSTLKALLAYRDLPARAACLATKDGPLFVSSRGTGYHRSTIELYFARLVTAAGLSPHGDARPRLHDLRHSVATGHMAAAYRDPDGDPERTLTLLTTWLGHTSTAHTYWYLSATPQLMALAAARLEPPAPTHPEPTPAAVTIPESRTP